MVKRIIILLFIGTIFFNFKNKNEVIIPNNAIRFRVIANSNSLDDQVYKNMIKDKVEQELFTLLNNKNTINDARYTIKDNMDNIKEVISKYNVPYAINFGEQYFPMKNYKGILYKAGNYEALVITIGEGFGDNFWCVLFPPLCLLDAKSEDTSEVEYRFYAKKILDKF